MFNSPISTETFPLFVVYDVTTGHATTFGTSQVCDDVSDGQAVIAVPPGMSPFGKKVDLLKKVLVDLPVVVDADEEREAFLIQIRQRRNALIAATDYLLMPDYPLTADQRSQVEAYRQALRNITEQSDLTKIVWPSPWNAPSA